MSYLSRNRLNLALLGTVALLAALAYLKPGMHHATDLPPLVQDVDGLHEIRIALTGKPETDLKRDTAGWRVQAPLQFPADDVAIQDFLDSLESPVENRFPAVAADLGKYGLDTPLAKLWLDGNEYDFGAVQPVSKQRYVLAAGEVLLVDDYLFYRVAQDAYGWLDRRLLPEGAHVTALQIPHATLTQDAKGVWQLAPADRSVTPAALQAWVQNWQDARAVGMAPIGKGKGKSEGEVALELAGVKDPVRFQILDDPDHLVLARPDLGLEYLLDIGQADTLLAPAATTH